MAHIFRGALAFDQDIGSWEHWNGKNWKKTMSGYDEDDVEADEVKG